MVDMKEIWHGQLESGSFCKLTRLNVRDCHKLHAVFTPSEARYLVHLRDLGIKKCSLLEVVVSKEEEEDRVGDATIFSRLETISLRELPALESFCYAAHDLEFRELSDLRVIDCPQLKTFSAGFVRTPKLNNVSVTESDAKKQVTLWEDNLNSTIAHIHKQYQFGFGSLQRLEVGDIDTLENLANAASSSLIFTTVETLSLENVDNLKQLSHSPLMVILGSFKNLTELCVSKCNKLKCLFQLSVATKFMHLKTIVIKDCKSMEEVIWKEREEDEANKLAFPKLERLIFRNLPKLVSFCRGVDEVEFPQLKWLVIHDLPHVEWLFFGLNNQSFFSYKVSFPRLEVITLEDMVNMKEIWCGQLQSGSFRKLTELYVTRCHKLLAVFTPSVTRYLVRLFSLGIEDCSLLEVVVSKEEEVEDSTLFPELWMVELRELPALESFCHVAHGLEFRELSLLTVIECPQLKTFSPGFVSTPKLHNVRLTNWEVALWEDNLNSTIAHFHKQNQEGRRHEDGIEEEIIEE